YENSFKEKRFELVNKLLHENLKAQTKQLWNLIHKKTSMNELEKKLKLALAIATTANIIEYDLLSQNNNFNLKNIEKIIDNAEWDTLSIELLPSLISEILEAKTILYLTDNAGEVIFDAYVIDILLQLNLKITVAGKSKPILNDATLVDLQDLWTELNTEKSPNILSIGTNSVGLLLDEISDEFQEILRKSDLIIAKGMGHFETLPEYDWNQSVWCLFHSKCEPVASEANSLVGKNCIRKIA
ncbi:MAG: ARMT1-like domain-containing protein, partial [Promethearchaeota archaeon]